ncbi:MAG: phosphoglucosamine mutase [Deltaproteobacteria bacterium]|nr:phosphoglucosamine mutase [Deltaproteobacteria bacterium]
MAGDRARADHEANGPAGAPGVSPPNAGTERAARRQLFGTDGIRGIANVEPLTAEMAIKLGRAAAYTFLRRQGRHRIVIGKDTRLSGYMLENALVAGICSMGVDVLLVGPLPTPGIAFITASMRADAGVVISASHNPFQDNGIKFFSGDGLKLPDELEERIEALIFTDEIDAIRPTATRIGKAFRIDDAIGRYVVFLKNTFPRELTLEGIRIVADCAHGAAYKVAPAVFEELGAEVIPLGINPNGRNINLNCGAVHPGAMAQLVRQTRAHLGVALDGDGDRAIFADENGDVVDGDRVMAACALEWLRAGQLRQQTLVATVMSNMGLDLALRRAGGRVVRTPVGDRYVVDEMLRGGYNMGGEQSGHVVFLDHNTTGDGIITALQVLALMLRQGRPLSEVVRVMTPFPQRLLNVPVRERRDLAGLTRVQAAIRDAEAQLGESGRVLVRYSGTEPVLRIMVEGPEEGTIKAIAEGLAACMRRELG